MKVKDRVFTYMCANATGSAKVRYLLSARPRTRAATAGSLPPIKYSAQNNAWSDDGATFRKWGLEIFLPFIRRLDPLLVLCLVDGCASHDLWVDPKG